MIRFYHDSKLVELDDIPADLTVLDWLRVYQQQTGTKEGCGSGDCGACTVVVASAVENPEGSASLHYESINSCITFIGALHGKQLMTVENLANTGELHPVQTAMVEEHGSQCGFCTPGFVMSLFALYQQDESEEALRGKVEQALGGNLCRCTGYRPIKQAANRALDFRSSLDESSTHKTRPQSLAMARQLLSIASVQPHVEGFHQPDSIDGLCALFSENPEARLLGGGTDMALEVTQQMKTLKSIIHVGQVPELNCVDIHTDHVSLGAAVTVTECLSILGDRIPGARELLLRFGSDQVRNQATIGGNIGSASPIADLPPLLIALNAELVVQSGSKTRQLPLEAHFLGYRQTSLQLGEFIRQINIPLPLSASVFSVHKISKRTEDDISSVCLAIHLPQQQGVCENARIAFGGMAAIPVRARTAEAALNGQPFTAQTVKEAQQCLSTELTPISDARASAAYRLMVAQNLLQRVYLESHA